jgi:hypothetical protein
MAKFRILGSFQRDQLERALPPEYRELARKLTHSGVEYQVVQFAHDRRDVVTSAPVRRALAEIPSQQAMLAIGSNFTAEATALLEEREAIIARLSDFYWTDESFTSLHR